MKTKPRDRKAVLAEIAADTEDHSLPTDSRKMSLEDATMVISAPGLPQQARANHICKVCGEHEGDRPHYMSEDLEKLRKQVPKLERRIAVLEAELRRLSRIISSESHTFERISKLLSSSFTPNSCRGCNLGFPLSEDGKFHEYPTSGRKHSRCLLGLIS